MSLKPAAYTSTTGPQTRLAYDATHYTDLTTGSGGVLTIAPSGGTVAITGALTVSTTLGVTGTATFGPPAGAASAFVQIKGATGGWGAGLKFGDVDNGFLAMIGYNINFGTFLEFYVGGTASGNKVGTWSTATFAVTGAATFSSSLKSGAGIMTNGGWGVDQASSTALDYASGVARWLAWGADSSTNGVLVIKSVRSNGTNVLTVLSTDTSGNVTFAQNATVTGTLSATGNFAINTTKFTVAAASGNTSVAGNVDVAGIIKVGVTTNSPGDFFYLGANVSTGPLVDIAGSVPIWHTRRANGTQASRTNVTAEDIIFTVRGSAWSGATGYWATAQIEFVVDGGVTDNQRPAARIQFTTNLQNASPTIQWKITPAGNLQAVNTGVAIQTGTPNGGTAMPWKFGQVAVVSPTSPNRTIELDVNGTTYYLAAKTTNN